MGYVDYVFYILEDCMVKNEENVYCLLNQIWIFVVVKVKEELFDIQFEIKKEGVNFIFEGWDWCYYFEKVKKVKFSLDENEVCFYFELNNVCEGVFYVVNRFYGIIFIEIKDILKLYEEVQVFECKDKDGIYFGVLYMDFFFCNSKWGGVWCGIYCF